MVRTGGTVALIAPHPLSGERTPPGRGQLVVDAPADAPLVIHASYAAVHIRDVKGSVRVAATHGRAKMLNTTGQVDAIAFVIDFAGSGGRVTLSAGARDQYETIQCAFRWDAPGLGAAIRHELVPPGFSTPFAPSWVVARISSVVPSFRRVSATKRKAICTISLTTRTTVSCLTLSCTCAPNRPRS